MFIIVAFGEVYRLRPKLDMCAPCDTGSEQNYINFLLLFLPVFLGAIGGVGISVYAFKNLKKGLKKTLALRKSVIRSQVVLVFCFTLFQLIISIPFATLIFNRNSDEKGKG